MIHKFQKILLTFVESLQAGSPLNHVPEQLEESVLAGRSLLKRHQDSEPALISVIFSFLLRLSEVK